MSHKDQVKLISALKEQGMHEIAEFLLEVLADNNLEMTILESKYKDVADNLEKINNRLDELRKSFPGEDIHGHRLYHERMMRDHIANEGMKTSVKQDIFQKVMLAIILIVLTAVGINLEL